MMFDELKAAPARAMRDLARFLAIEEGPASRMRFDVHNAYQVPRPGMARRMLGSRLVRRAARLAPQSLRNEAAAALMVDAAPPRPDSTTVSRLAHLFAPDVEALEALLERPLPELRRTWPLTPG